MRHGKSKAKANGNANLWTLIQYMRQQAAQAEQQVFPDDANKGASN